MTPITAIKATTFAACLSLGGMATAQDFDQNWEGFYGGVHLDMSVFTTDNADLNNQFNSNAPEQSEFLAHGGLSFGYNWQLAGGLILGGEFDYTSAMTIEEFISSNAASTTGTQVNNALDSVMSIRARAGVQNGNVLTFLTGGMASAASNFETYQVDTGGGQTSCANSTCSETTETLTGVTIGAGVEYAFKENLIGRFEVQHYAFDDVSAPVENASGAPACSGGATGLCSVIYSPSATSVRVGFIYKF